MYKFYWNYRHFHRKNWNYRNLQDSENVWISAMRELTNWHTKFCVSTPNSLAMRAWT